MTARLESSRSEEQGPVRRIAPAFGQSLGADLGASLVVFLVAVPLCVGIAIASGVPAELGIVSGIVGGLVVGCLPGSTMQVTGPAAGLTVLVASTVSAHGLEVLGVVVLGAGLLQVVMGVCGLGTWFRAISPSVVQGLLAGIGLVLILGQIYAVGGVPQPTGTGAKFAGLPELATAVVTTHAGRAGLAVAAVTIAVLVGWTRMPHRARPVPGPLVAVAVTTAATFVLDLPLATVEVGGLFGAVNVLGPASFGALTDAAVLGSVLTFALISSAASLFSAAAVDRMHDGPRTRYNTELIAQGTGNTVCGLLGALPMTAVIVRSSTNVRAGARTRMARVLHGVWMLFFVVLLPEVLSWIPLAVLAALLLHAGWKLLSVGQLAELARRQPAEACIVLLTATTIVTTDLLTGTLVGLAAAILRAAWELSRLSIESDHDDDHLRVRLHGAATFLRLPHLQDRLEQLPPARSAHVDLTALRHLDRACHQAVEHWVEQRRRSNCRVELTR